MSINSAVFLLFLLVSVVLYYAVPMRFRYLVLLAASVFFYCCYSLRAAVYLSATVLMTFFSALGLGKLHARERSALEAPDCDRKAVKSRFKGKRRRLLALALVVNFSTLVVFKYLGVWMAGFGRLLGNAPFRPLELLLPLGISFYIFQTSGYLIDVYRGRQQPERQVLKYALFVCYFPQMIQGPINRFGNLHPQLIRGNAFNADNLRYGLQLMMWGILKKVFIADPLAATVRAAYGHYSEYSGAAVLLGVVCYCLQLYCDFSGGTDLVRGASQLFGVEMAENFRRPYFARTVDEFWRRWHISLGEWMKDYLFYPLALSKGMARLGKAARNHFGADFGKLAAPCLSTVIVFLVVGIWQGPGMHNIAYGLWNGGLISLGMLADKPLGRLRERMGFRPENRAVQGGQILRTCLLVVIGRYFSRADGLLHALRMLRHTVLDFGRAGANLLAAGGLTAPSVWIPLAIACAVLLTVSALQEKGVHIRESLTKAHWAVQFLLFFGVTLLLVAMVYLNTDYTAIMYVYENI